MSNMEIDKLITYINKNILVDDNISEEKYTNYEDEEEYRKRKDIEDRINDVAYDAKKYMIEHDVIWWIPKHIQYKYNGHATSLGKIKTYCTCCGKTEVKEWLYNPRDIKEYLNIKNLTYNERVSIIKKKLIAFGGWEDDKTTEYFADYICRILCTPISSVKEGNQKSND